MLRAIETFSQLVWLDNDGRYRLNATTMTDGPRFSYRCVALGDENVIMARRGIMIDTARHYLPLDVIYQTMTAMEWNKFNVLHWHMTDDQSFPYQSRVLPDLIKVKLPIQSRTRHKIAGRLLHKSRLHPRRYSLSRTIWLRTWNPK